MVLLLSSRHKRDACASWGMEKVALMESLSDEEKQIIYIMLDAFIGKRKLKDALSNVLQNIK